MPEDMHARYPSDDGVDPETGTVPVLHILRDDQGDMYISIGGEKPGWTSVRLCSSGGAIRKAPGLYVAIAIAVYSLLGQEQRARRLALSYAQVGY
jgi:hypothetical protein